MKTNKEEIKEREEVVSPLALKNQLNSLSREELINKIQTMKEYDRQKVWRLLDDEKCVSLIENSQDGIYWFDSIPIKKESRIIEKMPSDQAIKLLESLDSEKRKLVLQFSTKSFPGYLIYAEDEVGSIMSDDFIVLDKRVTKEEALERIREESETKDNIRTIFLKEENGGLYGEVDLLDVLKSHDDAPLSSMATTSFPFVAANSKLSKTLEWIKDYNLSSFPVIDEEGKTIGTVTRKKLGETVEREMAEDYRKLASLQKEDRNMSVIQAMKSRLPWLFLLLLLGMVVSSAIGKLSELVTGLLMVFSFQSLILDMTGNSGTQTLAVAVRALSGRELSGKEKRNMLKKETSTGFLSGLVLGLGAFIVLLPYVFITSGNGIIYALSLSFSVSISLFVAMTLSNLIGATIPMVAEKFGVDPAVASGPLITTFNDLLGAFSYYGVVFILMKKILHL